MKIALVAFHFKPDEAIGAVRAENWADWLSDSHEVVVITREAQRSSESGDQRYRIARPSSFTTRWIDRLNEGRKRLRLRRARQSQAAPGNGVPAARATSGVFVYRMPCLYDFWLAASYRALRRERPDLVIATHSPYIGLISAWLYAERNRHARLWLDYRDLWSANHLARGAPVLRALERWLEGRALAKADVVSTVSEGLRQTLAEEFGRRDCVVVYNAPAVRPAPGARKRRSGSALVFCYTGTIYDGWRDPTPLLSLLRELKDTAGLSPARAQLQVASRRPGGLLALAQRAGVAEFVDFVGAVSREEARRLQEQADVLILLESAAPEAKGVLTGKVFEYLATDKPILLIGPDPDSELYRLLDQHGRLITLERIAAILVDDEPLPQCAPVDYATISRQQLLGALVHGVAAEH